MDQLVQVLRDSLSHDQTKLDNASQFLSLISQQNLPWLLQALLVIVSSTDISPLERQQAGLQLKRFLGLSKELPCNLQDGIKRRLVELLGCESWRPSTVGLSIQTLFEQDETEWPEIIPVLVNNISINKAMMASIETLGYLCSTRSKKSVLESHMDTILTGTIHCVTNPDLGIKMTALRALSSCLECAAANFARASERDVILQVVCEATQTGNAEVTGLAIECLNKMVSLFYCLLEDYMRPALVPLSLCCLKSDQERLVMLGIEFWSSVCEQEERLAADGDCEENTLETLLQNTGTSGVLVDSLLEVIRAAPESDRDLEIWSLSSAALNCLSLLVARSVAEVQSNIGVRIKENLSSESWQNRFTAIVSIGALLGMENETDLLNVVSSFLGIAESLLSDANYHIRLATASVLDKISDLSGLELLTSSLLSHFQSLCYKCILSEDQKIMEFGCFSSGSFFRKVLNVDNTYFTKTLQRLFSLTNVSSNFLAYQTIFSTIMDMMENCPASCQSILLEAAGTIILRMKMTMPINEIVSSSAATLLSLLCQTLNTTLCAMDQTEIVGLKDDIFGLLPLILHSEVLLEDGLLLVRSLVTPLGPLLAPVLAPLTALCRPHLETLPGDQAGLARAVVGLLGDLYAQTDLAPQLDSVTPWASLGLISNLAKEGVTIDLRADIISTIAEMILSSSNFFYTEDCLQIVLENNYLEIEPLASSCMDLLSSVLQTPMSDTIKHYLRAHSEQIMALILTNQDGEDIRCSCIGLLGDLALNLPQVFSNTAPGDVENIRKIVLMGQSSEDQKTRSIASWAGEQLLSVAGSLVESQAKVAKKARLGTEEVFYSVSVSVTNKQFITQNIETENVTIRLNTGPGRAQPRVIECSDVEATVSLPCPRPSQGEEVTIGQLRRQRKKRAAVSWKDEGEEEDEAGKRWREYC